MTNQENEIESVKSLFVDTNKSKDKAFKGLSSIKISRKDKHMKEIHEFSKFIENLNEINSQEVLKISRDFRECLEEFDKNLKKFTIEINEYEFLISKNEKEVDRILDDLKGKIQERFNIILNFESDLQKSELKRVDLASVKLKKLLDDLVSIAHQLPDEIEHIIESESYEINIDYISNLKEHINNSGKAKITHFSFEGELLKSWETCKSKWRKIKHEKTINDFLTDIKSIDFREPKDRVKFLQSFCNKQDSRISLIRKEIEKLYSLNADSISSESVMSIQEKINEMNENEIHIIQECYNNLNNLREDLNFKASERVEIFRHKLHEFGFLKLEPDLEDSASKFANALQQEDLSELWRLGGGLKDEFNCLINELKSDDVIYERVISTIKGRLETIISGFELKSTMEERGRASQLEKIKNLIVKMRTSPRDEIPHVLKSLHSELEYIATIETLPPHFLETLKENIDAIDQELVNLDNASKSLNTNSKTQSATKVTFNPNSSSTATLEDKISSTLKEPQYSQTQKSSIDTLGKSSTLNKTKGFEEKNSYISQTIDPNLVKKWNKRLGILFFSSDIPIDYQQACIECLDRINTKNECNGLIDELVLGTSESELYKINKRYKNLIDKIANFLETQASLQAISTTNICKYYAEVAKKVELNSKLLKEIDHKSLEENWDTKEDFRIECEDKEELFQASCQKIREATKQEDIEKHFLEVLNVLEEIQSTYREFHTNICFVTDKYPLMLINEYRRFICELSNDLFLKPMSSHSVLREYTRIFDSCIRFNQPVLEKKPDAIGIDKIDIDQDSSIAADVIATNKESMDDSDNRVEDKEPSDDLGGSIENQTDETSYIVYKSLLHRNDPNIGNAFVGSYIWSIEEAKITEKFNSDTMFPDPEDESNEIIPSNNDLVEDSNDPAVQKEADSSLENEDLPEVTRHTNYHWLNEAFDKVPLDKDQYERLDDIDMEEYNDSIQKYFLGFEDEEKIVEIPDNDAEDSPQDIENEPIHPSQDKSKKQPTGGIKAGIKAAESTDDTIRMKTSELEIYRFNKELVIELKNTDEEKSSASYTLEHPPTNLKGEPVVRSFKIRQDDIIRLVSKLRDDLLSRLEKESFNKVFTVESEGQKLKTQYTDQLEDRIRNHWPRRGRVETQIKQPREAELMNHREKTWRLIQNIQQKMIDLQSKFQIMIESSHSKCDNYINEITSYRNSLSKDFKSLAALQGIDIKARSATTEFKQDFANQIQDLNNLVTIEIDLIISFARDFRKICPPQVPGEEGGYSQSEIDEIEEIVESQCKEIKVVAEEWKVDIEKAKEEQLQSLKCYDEFIEKYKKSAQDVAMSEGLGQKYGAPRRRAQEKIRTEVTLDEQCTGKIDECLANLEFICKENSEMVQSEDLSPWQQDHLEKRINDIVYSWKLLSEVRDSLGKRVQYLKVELDPLKNCSREFPWISDATIEKFTKTVPDLPSKVQPAYSSLEEMFKEVDKSCREETRELYKSEGLLDKLGANGIPDSLETWLEESKNKLFGASGYREKAWKKLWMQIARSETILSRHLVLNESLFSSLNKDNSEISIEFQNKYSQYIGVISIIFRSFTHSFISATKSEIHEQQSKFEKLLIVWEKGKEKHQRLLRPKLGSPDLIQELKDLDQQELNRSSELSENVRKIRSHLIRHITQSMLEFFEELSNCAKGMILMLDSTFQQQNIQVPPGMEVPKKHMSLKKLRKIQRVQEKIKESGQNDPSKYRIWPGLDVKNLVSKIEKVHELVGDLGQVETDLKTIEEIKGLSAVSSSNDKDKKNKKPEKAASNESKAPSLVPSGWDKFLKELSEVPGEVSISHRIVVNERDRASKLFESFVEESLQSLRDDYDAILSQEQSWIERWRSQVELLKQGSI